MISPEKATEILNRQREVVKNLYTLKPFSLEYKKWQRDSLLAVERIFGEDGRHSRELPGVFMAVATAMANSPAASDHTYRLGLKQAEAVLLSMADEVREYGIPSTAGTESNPLDQVRRICSRFHRIARQLRERHDNRPTLKIASEYDVQDLLHSLLHLYFDDIRREPWTPIYAGCCSRMDFLLKQEQIVIEVKWTRSGLGAKQIGDQLIIDIDRYKVLPDCKCLVCFVYDPEKHVKNPHGLENDLSGNREGVEVAVIVTPRS